ncbi:MAG: hypothetical protein FWG71_03740 [Synergistaceae bacterium]|nr:hypothetical protein [Synergistaceae bacterium]
MLHGKVGTPVIGQDEFFDRERELAQLVEKIERGDSVYISAPRRIGKTSLMHKAKEELTKIGHTCLFFDLEGYLTPSGWISDWFAKAVSGKETKLTDKVSMVLKNLCKGMGTSDSVAEGVLKGLFDESNWRDRGNAIFDALVNSLEETERLVVFLDELAVMIEHFNDRKTEADFFLSWLRGVQQKHHNKLSFVAASSIGLSPLLNKLGLSSRMNAFSVVSLDAWDHETAVRCIHALARGAEIEISNDVALCMVDHIGWCSPFYVQLFFDVLKDECRDKVCTCEDATKIYRKKIVRGQEGNYQLNHLEERLRKIFSEQEYTLAMQILSYLSEIDEAVKGKELIERAKSERYHVDSFQNIMQNLEHDGYIEKLENGWRFRAKLLKDWWRHRYGDM